MKNGNTIGIVTALLVSVSLVGCGGGPAKNGDDSADNVPTPSKGSDTILENFDDETNLDGAASEADWGATEVGILKSLPTTSRNVYCMGYQETLNGANSGLGQYWESPAPLIGAGYANVNPNVAPATNFGRRMQICIPDVKLGDAGIITNIAWGPANNATFAATYSNVKIRLGYLDSSVGTSLGSHAGNNFADTPTVVYDGAYSVSLMADVGNTTGQPATGHVGNYPQGLGCLTTSGGWNKSLFDFTGFYDWPALTTFFDWSPGDPLVDNDSILIIDISAVQGTTYQLMRGWYAVTSPCSGVLIGGLPTDNRDPFPRQRLDTTYEADAANPTANFVAGILNPSPALMDVCITLTRKVSVAQSNWIEGAYGDTTDYQTPVITPATQTGGARIIVEYQGADRISGGSIDMSKPFTDWVTNIDDCDGMQKIRFRIRLIADPTTGTAARVESVKIVMKDSTG